MFITGLIVWVKMYYVVSILIVTNIEILGVIECSTLTLALLITKQQLFYSLDPLNANKVKYKNNNMTQDG